MDKKIFRDIQFSVYVDNDKDYEIHLLVTLTIKQKEKFYKASPVICIENAKTENKKLFIRINGVENQFFDKIFEKIFLAYLEKKEIKTDEIEFKAIYGKQETTFDNFFITDFFYDI